MSKLYTFSMPFSGRQTVWLEAESEEEARAMVRNGDWEDSEEQTFDSHNLDARLIEVEDIPEEETE
jgi:hypothetical protein